MEPTTRPKPAPIEPKGTHFLGRWIVAMYIQLLSAVLMADAPDAVPLAELLLQARTLRHQMLTATGYSPASAERNLAYNVNYDCSVIRLCLAVGLPAAAASFGRPRDERARLEQALAEAGVDLAEFARPR